MTTDPAPSAVPSYRLRTVVRWAFVLGAGLTAGAAIRYGVTADGPLDYLDAAACAATSGVLASPAVTRLARKVRH